MGEQARAVAAAWSPPDAPPSWWLTAAAFTAIAEDDDLLDLAATGTVQGLEFPPDWLRDNRDGGVFGVIGRVGIRDGERRGTVLGRAHPGSAWAEWTAAP